MAEDPIEKPKCIICGKETDMTTFVTFENKREDNVPICGGCEAATPFPQTLSTIKEYVERRDSDDISRTLAIEMKKRGYEHYMGQDMQGSESRHFIKEGILVTIIVNHCPDEETLEAVRGE